MPNLLDESMVPHWHRSKERFMAILRAYLEPLEGNNKLMENLSDQFDIETASGVQLDMIGKILGVGNTCNRAPDYEYRTLNDDLYRFVLMARILYATWDGTVEGYLAMLESLFPDVPHGIIDNQDCSYELLLNPELSYDKPLHILFTGYEMLPHPVGVLMNISLKFVIEQTLYAYHAVISRMKFELGRDNADPDYYLLHALCDENGAFLMDENDTILTD